MNIRLRKFVSFVWLKFFYEVATKCDDVKDLYNPKAVYTARKLPVIRYS